MINNLKTSPYSIPPRARLNQQTTQLSTAPTMAPTKQLIENGTELKSMDGSAMNNIASQNTKPKIPPPGLQLCANGGDCGGSCKGGEGEEKEKGQGKGNVGK